VVLLQPLGVACNCQEAGYLTQLADQMLLCPAITAIPF